MRLILVCIAFIITVLIIGYQQSKIEKLHQEMKSITNIKDSLYDELFYTKVMLNRYELTLEHIERVDKKAALEFVNFMNHETE